MRQRDQEIIKQIEEIKTQQVLLEQQRQQSKEARQTTKANYEDPGAIGAYNGEVSAEDLKANIRRSSSMNSATSARMHDVHLDHPKVISSSKFPIYRICLTGGPCAGKTTALATIS